MAGNRALLRVWILAACTLVIAAAWEQAHERSQKLSAVISSEASLLELEGSDVFQDTMSCTGSQDPPTQTHSHCYSGTKMGEAITIKVASFDQMKKGGSLSIIGSGLSPVKCTKDFSKAEQLISVTKLEECLPSTVTPSSLKYCSDQNSIILDATVAMHPVEMILITAPCPAALLEEEQADKGDRDNLLSHSAWIWDSNTCTGSAAPVSHSPFCYSGSKMGEVVSIKVGSFDEKSNLGSVLVTGSGLTSLKCQRDFTKVEQLISVTKLQDCLPSTVTPSSLKYCSDQDQVLLDAKVGVLSVQMVLIPSPCPTSLLEHSLPYLSAEASSLVQTDWLWDSISCTGSLDPPAEANSCFTGSKMGETVTINVKTFDKGNSAGSVMVTAAGLAPVKCERGFSKAQQMISVTKLEECLPSTVKPSGIKYCSDQNTVILDAHVGGIPVELVLTPAACPSVLLDQSSSSRSSLVQGEIFSSGAQRLVRSEGAHSS